LDKGSLTVLKAEIEAQVREIDNVYVRLQERMRSKGKPAVESIGYQLHNLYRAFEYLFEMVAETFENNVHDRTKYHLELLKRMTVPIQGVRPSLVAHQSFLLLDNLRAFRHFFRHAYSYDLDERKVRIVLSDALALKDLYKADIDAFLSQL
jgi:hypothetical protein